MVRMPYTGLFRTEGFSRVFYGQKGPQRTFINRGRLTDLLVIEEISQIFKGSKNFYEQKTSLRSPMNRKSLKGLLWIENLLQVF